jgi:acyl carrier protein
VRASAEGDVDRGADLKALVAGRTREDARRAVGEALANEVAAVLQLPPGRVELSRPLAELGMDSLMAVELRLAVEARFGVSLPLFSLSEGLTVAGMAARLVDPLLPGEADAPAAAISLAMNRHEAAPDLAPDPGEHRLAEAQA